MTSNPQTRDSDSFHSVMHENHMYGLWELASQMTPHPTPKMVPHIWRWSVLEQIVRESSKVVPLGNERRALQLFNPGLEGRWATTNNLIAAVQILLPGEVARAHRHTPVAIRFIMQGEGAYTAVDGERVAMEPGDLILTPSWSWHDHGNEGSEAVVWLDGLDIPLVKSMEAMFFQTYDEQRMPITKAENSSRRLHGHVHLAPTWVKEKPASSPLLVYGWQQTKAALNDLRSDEGDPFDGVALEYRHPQTGGHVLPTMACWIQLIRPAEHLKAHRHTGSAIYQVAQGRGQTIIDGEVFDWQKGDILAIPPWSLHEHANIGSEDAILFSIQDQPVLEALGLYREEALAENLGRQLVAAAIPST